MNLELFLEMILDPVMDLLRNIKIEFWAWDGFYFIDPDDKTIIQSWVFARHRDIGARQKVAPGQKSAGGGGA